MSTLQTTTVEPTPSTQEPFDIRQRWKDFVANLAYKNQSAELVSICLFISGVLLWEAIPLEWDIVRWSLLLHLLVGLILFPLTTGLFWMVHRRLMISSTKPRLRTTGRILDICIAGCFVSGLLLVFLGDTGSLAASLTSDTHWLSGLILGPLMLIHAWHYSVFRFKS